MADRVKYLVAAPYVTVKYKDRDGNDLIAGFYAGATLPESADEATVERLLEKDMVLRADDPVAGIVAVPSGTPIPGEPPNVPVAEVPLTSHAERMERARARALVGKGGKAKADDKAEAKADGPEPPAVADAKAAWVDYAVYRGTDRAAAEAMSKEQLVGRFGKRG